MYGNTRKHNKDILIIYKKGKFYNTYGDDSIIINYLFGYKILRDEKTGFPENTLTKVLNTLENKKINYTIINKNENPITKSYNNLNNYHKILNKAYEYQNIKVRVNRIYDKLNSITDVATLDNILNKLEVDLFE